MRLAVRRGLIALGLSFAAGFSHAAQTAVSRFEYQDFELSASTHAWAEPPGNHHRLYLDVYNVTDFFDAETGNSANFADHTILADTLRPTATLLWDDRFRIQAGLIALKSYGSDPGFQSVDPWLQLLWQPIQPLSVIFGNLDTPHYYFPALFYPGNYFEQNFNPNPALLPKIPQLKAVPSNYFTQTTNETGAQLILQKPHSYDDFFFQYQQQDIAAHNEKFALGFVHRNAFWDTLSLHYQAHWIHYGGEFNPHPIFTRNDVAQAVGAGLYQRFARSLLIGGRYTYFNSHLRQETNDVATTIPKTDGNGSLWEAYARYARAKLIYGYWRGKDYYHEGGDPMFILPRLIMLSFRYDILLSRDFNLYAETTEYFIGNNNLGYDHAMKSAIHIQASWQFSVPIIEWTSPAASPEGPPVPARWDYGL